MTDTIPFEIHLTTGNIVIGRQDDFVNLCLLHNAKPLLIELSRGQFIHQPMLSKVVYANNLGDVLPVATALSKLLENSGFSVRRLKIEIPSEDYDQVEDHNPSSFSRYFEWHGKIHLTNPFEINQLCTTHKVHLSINALNKDGNTRFITLREFGDKEVFAKRILSLSEALLSGGWRILKHQSEYCIYDNNNFLDTGWLPQ